MTALQSAMSRADQQGYKRAEGAESRDSDEPYEDNLSPESYEDSVSGKVNRNEADQAGL